MAEAWISAAAAAAPPSLQAPLQELGDLAGRKLYKQLTDALVALLSDPANAQQLSYKDLYDVRSERRGGLVGWIGAGVDHACVHVPCPPFRFCHSTTKRTHHPTTELRVQVRGEAEPGQARRHRRARGQGTHAPPDR